jgi:uncharacterized protein
LIVKAEKYQRIELIALCITAISKFVLMDRLEMRAFYISGTCIFWLSYILFRYHSDKSILKFWGFKKENFSQSLIILLPLLFLSVMTCLVYGYYTDNLVFNWHILLLLFLYPLWGVFQQFFMLALVAQNLMGLNKLVIMLITSSLFSIIHYPSLFLMIFTFFLEIVFIRLYLKWKNLWAVGIVHGWIASFLLFYILGRDLWLELFAWFE